jgi:hypothetical protein
VRIVIAALLGVCLALAGAPGAVPPAHAKPAEKKPSTKAEIVSAANQISSTALQAVTEIEAKLAEDKLTPSERSLLEKDKKKLKKLRKALAVLANEQEAKEREELLAALQAEMETCRLMSSLMKSYHDTMKALIANLKA